MGLPVNDGTVLRPIDEPVTAEILPDWKLCMTEALMHRVELRRQKWNLKSLELQLRAARSLKQPRLDFLGSYQVNGFGDHLFANTDADAFGTSQGLNDFYETITQGDQTGWNLGLQMSMPIGFRSAQAQIRNYEIRIAKAQQVLAEQEREIGLELAVSMQDLARAYQSAEFNLNRLLAARENLRGLELRRGEADLADVVLRSQSRLADAEQAYYQSLVDYNKALVALQFRKGLNLEQNGIYLAEGGWFPEAYQHAQRLSNARAHAFPDELQEQEPPAFASPAPVTGVSVLETPVWYESADAPPAAAKQPE
jgi:outer membrane protein TolC